MGCACSVCKKQNAVRSRRRTRVEFRLRAACAADVKSVALGFMFCMYEDMWSHVLLVSFFFL